MTRNFDYLAMSSDATQRRVLRKRKTSNDGNFHRKFGILLSFKGEGIAEEAKKKSPLPVQYKMFIRAVQ